MDAEKYCEGAIDFTYLLSICGSDGRPLFKHDTYGNVMETHEFYKIENGTLELDEKIEIYYGGDAVPEEVDKAFETYEAILQKFTDEKELMKRDYSSGIISVSNRGLLPSREEYEAAQAQRWANHWAEIDPAYAAVLKGDFSAFAGRYADISGLTGDIALGIDGAVTGDYITNQKPVSVTVREDGTIYCTVKWYEEKMPDGGIRRSSERYIIYPVGIADNGDPNTGYQGDPSKVRIEYWWPSQGVDMAMYSRIS